MSSSRSAYACFLFAPSFFHHYDDGGSDIDSQDSDDSLRCKIAMKVGEMLFYSSCVYQSYDILKKEEAFNISNVSIEH